MPMENIMQPDAIMVDETLRLRRFDCGDHAFALEWYQDTELVKLVDGVEVPYSPEKLEAMYSYLDKQGELYFIELLEDEEYVPVGDVCLWKEDMPIVVSTAYQKKSIGKRVIRRLVERARQLGWDEAKVDMIYHYNEGSRRLFEGLGFIAYETNEKGSRYSMKLEPYSTPAEFLKDRMIYRNEAGEEMGYIKFEPLKKELVNILSVYTDPKFRGQGVAAKMMKELFLDLECRNCKAVLTCSYAQKYMVENPQWSHLLPGNIKFSKI